MPNYSIFFLQVANGSSNMSIGGLIITELQSRPISFTYPHLIMDTMFATPVGLPYSSMARIAMPFSDIVWMCTLIATLFTFAFLYLSKILNRSIDRRSENWNFSVIFELIESSLGNSMPVKILNTFNRSGLTIWLLGTLVLRHLYLCSLFDLLQMRITERPVDSIERLIQSKFKIYCSPAAYDAISHSIPELREQLVTFHYLRQFTDSIQRVAFLFQNTL